MWRQPCMRKFAFSQPSATTVTLLTSTRGVDGGSLRHGPSANHVSAGSGHFAYGPIIVVSRLPVQYVHAQKTCRSGSSYAATKRTWPWFNKRSRNTLKTGETLGKSEQLLASVIRATRYVATTFFLSLACDPGGLSEARSFCRCCDCSQA